MTFLNGKRYATMFFLSSISLQSLIEDNNMLFFVANSVTVKRVAIASPEVFGDYHCITSHREKITKEMIIL